MEPKNLLKILWQIFALSVTLYGLLCTVSSDVIIQNDNEFIRLSKLILPKNNIKNFNELIGEENEKLEYKAPLGSVHYIFVLDISGSFLNRKIPKEMAKDYEQRISLIKELSNDNVKVNKNVNVLNIAKSKLFEILIDIYRNHDRHVNDYFSIWTLGDIGKVLYPPEKPKEKIEINKQDIIIRAMKTINDDENIKPNENTDFNDLLRKLIRDYEDDFKEMYIDKTISPKVIITFISDLLHDVDNINEYKERERRINENWIALEEKIKKICTSRVIVNLIVFSNKDKDNRRSIFSSFENHLDWHRLNKQIIDDITNTDLLFPVRYVKNYIDFSYATPKLISDISSCIKFSNNEENNLGVSILFEESNNIVPRIDIRCEILETQKKEIIFSNSDNFRFDIPISGTLKLTFNNIIIQGILPPFLKISDYKKRVSYLIPIYFIKKLPENATYLFHIFRVLIFLSSLFIILILGVSARPKLLRWFFSIIVIGYIILMIFYLKL